MRSDNIRKYMFIKDDISRNMNGIRLKVYNLIIFNVMGIA